MKVTASKNDSKKRKRDHSEDAVTESPKKAKVHAQRKFAQGAYNSPSLTVIKDKVRPQTNVTSPGLVLSAKRPNTEDFLTFLCFRRTSILPPKLDFFKDAFKHQPVPPNCVQKTPNSTPGHKNNSADSSNKSSSKKNDKTEPNKKLQTPVQALRRKYQEQRLAKQNPINVRKLAQKVKGKNMIRTRSSTIKDEPVKPKKEVEKLNDTKTAPSGLRSGLQRTPPAADTKKKKKIEVKNLRSRVKGKILNNKPKPKPLPEKKNVKVVSREVTQKRNEIVKNIKSIEAASGKLKDVRVSVRKIEGLSDFSSDDNEPLLAVRKGKPAMKGKKLTNGIKESPRPNSVKTRSQATEVPHVSSRPTRKTKEAAAIYMEMITKKLVSPEKSGDDDRSSVDSFPELPNARRNEQRESEIKARAMAMKKGPTRESTSNTNFEGRSNRSSALGKRKDVGKNVDSGRNESAKKMAVAKKVTREESPKKTKEDTSKKVEVTRKNLRDERKGANEELSKKVLRDRKRVPEEVPKKSTTDPGKDEGLKRGGRDDSAKKHQEDNSRKSVKEETVKKVPEDFAKRPGKEEPVKKQSDDSVKKVNKDEMLKKSQEDAKKNIKDEIVKKNQDESSRKNNKEEVTKKSNEENVKRGNKDEAVKKNSKDETVKKVEEVKNSKEEIGKKNEEDVKKSVKEETKKVQEDSTKKVNKDETKKNEEENVKKCNKDEIGKRNHEDSVKKIVKEVPKIIREVVSKKSDVDDEVPKKIAKEDVKKGTQDDVKKSVNEIAKKIELQKVVSHDKKPVKEDEPKKQAPTKEEETKNNVKEEVVQTVVSEGSAVPEEPPKKVLQNESVKDGVTKKEEEKTTVDANLTPKTENEDVKNSVPGKSRETPGEVEEKKTDAPEGPQKVVQDTVDGPAGKEEVKKREVSPKRTIRTSSKETESEKAERKSSEEDSRPSTRGRKLEEPELKQKKVPERTSGVKKPTSVPKRGSGSGSSTPSQSWLPPPGSTSNLLEAPTFYPTEKEFQDPLEFFEKIRPAAESFGLCRIVPPSTFKPDCKVSDDMRFTAYNQYVHRMYHRWGPNIKEMMAIKKYLATQSISLKQPPWIGGIEVDLPRLYQSVQNCGGLMKVMEKKKWHQVADMMRIPKAAQDRVTKLDDIYCKYLLPYDTLSPDERQKLFDEVESDWLRRQETAVDEDSEEFYIDECEECIVKGRNMALNQFYRIARNTMSMWFKSQEPPPSEVENEFWRHVSERNSHVCVHSGSIDSSGWGYGFPVAKNNSFSRHPWNLKVLTNNSGSVLRSLGPVMGVTVPTLHVGMVFTAFCWYRDPHGLPWVEYLHTGAPKIWYGISDDNSSVFKEALTKLLPRYIKNKKIWLPSDTAMVPPALLVEQGVSLCHTIQKPGQFILVFPRAFTSSICTGYLVSESVYFAQPSWLTTAEQVFRDIQDCCEPTMFSLEKLVFSIATDTRCSVEVLKQVLPMVWHIKQNEIDGRKTLFNLGLKASERLPVRDQAGNRKKKGRWAQDGEGDYECEVCRTNLCVSLVINSQEEGVLCLPHAIELLTQKRHHLKYCKLMYSYTQEELCELVEKLEQRIESKSQKKVQSKSATAPK